MKKVIVLLSLAVGSSAQEPLVREDAAVQLRFHAAALQAPLADGLFEGAWQVVLQVEAQLKKLDLVPPSRLGIELHAAAATFRAARARSGPRFAVDDFADAKSATAHVLLTPLPPQALAVVGLPPDSRDGIVRQLVWLAAARTPIGARDPWLCQVVAARVLDELDHPAFTTGVDPRFDLRRLIYRELQANGADFTLGEWVRWSGEPRNLDELHSSWEISGWCAQLLPARAGWAKKLLHPGRAAKKLTEPVEIRRAQLETVFGGKWKTVEADLQQLIRRSALGWLAFGPMVVRRDDHLLLAGGEKEARLERFGELPQHAYVVRAKVESVDIGDPHWRVEFHRGERVFGVLLWSDECAIGQWAERWEILARCNVAGMTFRSGELTIEVGEELVVRVGGDEAVRAPLGIAPPHDRIRILVSDGVLRLRDLSIEPLPQKR